MSLAAMLVIASLPAFGLKRTGVTILQYRGSSSAYIVSRFFAASFFTWRSAGRMAGMIGGFEFEAVNFAVTGAPSLLLLWIREKTGSVVLPIIGHNVANGAFALF